MNSLSWLLHVIYSNFQTVGFLNTIGAYGVAIIVLTLIIRLILSPLFQFQLVTQRRSMVEQRKLSPQISELRKKYKKDPQKLNSETMKLYQEHGVNPFGSLIGCLPAVVQMPVLIALYYVFTNFARSSHVATHFFFVPNLNDNPLHHLLIPGLPIPSIAYLIFPLLAALTTLVQSRMMQMPPSANPSDQEIQAQQMQRTMVLISPLMIGVFALNVPAGLGLYWFVGNCVSIIQQSFIVGWGNIVPARFRSGSSGSPPVPPGTGTGGGSKSGPKNAPPNGPRNGPNNNGPKNRPNNGPKPKPRR